MLSNLLPYLQLNLIRARQKTEFYQPTYNPRNLFLWPTYPAKRDCDDRYNLITQHLPLTKIASALDIGSQLGYFCFRLFQEHQLFALGIDRDPNAIAYAQAVSQLNHTSNTAFAHLELTPQTATKLPQVDLILFLDVFHHLVWHQGFEAADQIMQELSQKCTYLVFETGQSDEPNQPWTQALEFMHPDPNAWIKKYLAKHGFSILHQTSMPTHLTPQPRTFFICKHSRFKL